MYAWQWATIATLYREAGGGEPPFVLYEHVLFVFSHAVSRRLQAQSASPIVWRAVRSAMAREDKTDGIIEVRSTLMSIVNENDEANRAISKAKLHALLHVHTPPINVVVFHGPDREYSFSGGFPA
jgi:hypothetical protein